MKKFEILGHTADLKIRAFGKTKQELFSNALKGMFIALRAKISAQGGSASGGKNQKSTIKFRLGCPERSRGTKIKKEIFVKSSDINALLVDFLSEALYQSNINKEIYTGVDFNKFSDTEIEAMIYGQKYEELGEEIKAVTYHGLEIKQGKDGVWEVEVLFDI